MGLAQLAGPGARAGRSARCAPPAAATSASWRWASAVEASSMPARSSLTTAATTAPEPSRRPGTARHAATRRANRSSTASSRALSTSPWDAAATSSARSGARPSATSTSATAAAETAGKSTRTQRDAMVTSSSGTSSARTTKTVPPGGSSTVFSSLPGGGVGHQVELVEDEDLARRPPPASWTPSARSRRPARTRMLAPSRRTTVMSGCWSAAARVRWRAAPSSSSAVAASTSPANTRAAAWAPLPGGPRKR